MTEESATSPDSPAALASAANWPRPLRALSGASRLRLDGDEGVFLVVEGHVNIFCIDAEPDALSASTGDVAGRRHFLARVSAGEIFLGLSTVGGRPLVAVGGLNATVAYAPDAEAQLASLADDISAKLLAEWWRTLQLVAGTALDDLPQGSLNKLALKAFHDAAAATIAERFTVAHAAYLDGVSETWRGSNLALTQGLSNLAGVLVSDASIEVKPSTAGLDSPLVRVARRVLLATGIETPIPSTLMRATDMDALLDGMGVKSRKVLLRDDWWRHENGPLMGTREDGRPVGLLPTLRGMGYDLVDAETGTRQKIDAALADTLSKEAAMLYRRLPDRPLRAADLWRFAKRGQRRDATLLLVMGIAAAALGMFVPVATGFLIESVIPRAAYVQHWQLAGALLAAAIGAAGFELTKSFAMLRLEGRADAGLQSALFDRMLRLPVGFFKKFTAGDLGDRVLGIQTIRETLSVTVTSAVLAALFSLTSLMVMFWYSWKLSLIGVAIVGVVLIISNRVGAYQLREEREQIAHQGRVEGLVLQFIIGVSKLRVAAAETRAFAAWADAYQSQKRRFANAQRAANVQELMQSCVPLLASVLIFAGMVWLLRQSAIDLRLENLANPAGQLTRPTDEPSKLLPVGEILAFNAAFGQFLQAMIGVTLALTRAIGVIPLVERLRPLLETVPEGGPHQQAPRPLKGGVEFANVSFRYLAEGPPLLDRVSVSIVPGQFVAIVGPSGSGKSTLMRLMMGFELPERGEIFFDGQPLSGMDLAALRRAIGVVLQSGRISSGSVFTNIAGSAQITQADAMHAARLVGLDADIEAMPMGMHTVLQEGGSTLSGGQRQRLLLARALARKPAILLLDEATSALDNVTQTIVMQSLSRLQITRVVIAHRLSTIMHADQILVVKEGKIVESGNYAALMAANGIFAELARRQLA